MLAVLLDAAEPLFAQAFAIWDAPVTWLEVVAFVLAIAMVLCNFRVHPLAWPLAIVSSLLYALLFYRSRLYGEGSLQIYFAVVGVWGWWQWLRGHAAGGGPLVVHRLDARGRWLALIATLALWPLLATFLDRATDTDVPWFDALPTVGSVTGQILLARKLIENWPVWLAVNVVSTLLFAVKGLWLTVLLYALFVVLSAVGWRAWARLEGRARG